MDISARVRALCEGLGLEYTMVAKMIVSPTTITATVYEPNQTGQKHLIDGIVQTTEREFDWR